MAKPRTPIPEEMKQDLRERVLTNTAIAEKYGMCRNTVMAARRELNIEPAHLSVKIPLHEEHLLGTAPDEVLATRWDTNRANVARYRKFRGIQAFAHRQRLAADRELVDAQLL